MASINVNQEDIVTKTSAVFDQLEEIRIDELKNLVSLKKIQDQNLQTEHKRLTEKYGADHPRVQKMATQLAYHQELFKSFKQEQARSNTKTSAFDPQTWRIHGIVYNPDNIPQKGLTVFLSDANKRLNKESGYTCTNEQGYYSIALNKEQIGSTLKLPLFLTVSDDNQKNLYMDKETVEIKIGHSDVKDIFLTSDFCAPTILS